MVLHLFGFQLLHGAAESADFLGGGHATPLAFTEFRRGEVPGKVRFALFEEPQKEHVFGPGRPFLKKRQGFLVVEAFGLLGEGTPLRHKGDTVELNVPEDFLFREGVEGLDLPRHFRMGAREVRVLVGKVVNMPVQDITKERGCFIVEVVTGGVYGKTLFESETIEDVTLNAPAEGTGGPFSEPAGGFRKGTSNEVLNVEDGQGEVAGPGKGGHNLAGFLRVLSDTKENMHSENPVAGSVEVVPQGHAVFPPRHPKEHLLVPGEHPFPSDSPFNLALEEEVEAFLAEGGIVPFEFRESRLSTAAAFHDPHAPRLSSKYTTGSRGLVEFPGGL